MADLLSRFPRGGRVEWIGIRPERRAALQALDEIEITLSGLVGDHRTKPGKRAVTLIQAEHLPAIAALGGLDHVDPEQLRRNIVVSGISLIALRKIKFRIGNVVLMGSGVCAPCSRMEETLGHGGYNAMRGHGGITAEVLEPGSVKIGDAVTAIPGPPA